MQTASVMIQSLCVPCCNRCRYCLLSWDGTVEGADWNRSVALAKRFLHELREQRPDVSSSFSFGYAMEHPNLPDAIRTLSELGSPTAHFLQCDGMRMRNDAECSALTDMLRREGIERLGFTVYGLAEYHDRFAGRTGDYALLLRMMRAASASGIPFDTGIPLTSENADQIDELADTLKAAGNEHVRLFVPHEEGRGKALRAIRIGRSDLARLSDASRRLLNETVYRTESDWLQHPEATRESKRQILISLRRDTIDEYEKRSAESVVKEIESLDEQYYAAFPCFEELAERYGDPHGEKLYRSRDLFHHYRMLYAEEYGVCVCDVTDERRSGSRRY